MPDLPHPPGPSEALAALQRAQARDGRLSLAERRRLLAALAGALVARADAVVAAADADYGGREGGRTGRAAADTLLGDVLVTVQAARRARRWLRWWARPRFVPVPVAFQPALAWTEWVPKGVVGVMAPWNYPLQLALWPALEAVAAGNRVAIKPSEHAPRVGAVLASIVAEAWGPDVARVVEGDAAVGRAFAAQPWDHLVFTGGTETGRRVAAAAATNLVPLTLELGGRCPAVVLPGARLDRAARAILAAKAVNAGQTCVAPDTVILVGHARADFHRACRAAGIASETRVAPWAAERALALCAGAAPLSDGPSPLFLGDDPAAESFGPLLGCVECGSVADALRRIAAHPPPLAVLLFGATGAEEAEIARTVRAGAIVSGRALEHAAFPALPFGGAGASGMGRYHGRAGFEAFSDQRARVRHGPWSLSRLLDPPRGDRARRLARRLVR